MKRPDDTRGYYLLPIWFLAIGIFALFIPDGRLIAILFLSGSVFTAVVAFLARRKSKRQK